MESVPVTVNSLEAALDKAVARCTGGSERMGILFSGGLDSSLIAKICEDLGVELKLYSVAMEGSHDYRHIKDAAGSFKYDFVLKTIEADELPGYAKKVIAAVGSRRPLDVTIGIPFYSACEAAGSEGCDVVLIGQGADELFAGYHRYLNTPLEELEGCLRSDLEKLRREDIRRDESIARVNGLDLRAPYIDDGFVKIAKGIPVDLKLRDGVRKHVLREVARKRGLPSAIVNGEKKAVQYSTGVDKALRKIAKNEGKDLRSYLGDI